MLRHFSNRACSMLCQRCQKGTLICDILGRQTRNFWSGKRASWCSCIAWCLLILVHSLRRGFRDLRVRLADLVGALQYSMLEREQYADKMEAVRQLLMNMHTAINRLREWQARELIIERLQSDLQRKMAILERLKTCVRCEGGCLVRPFKQCANPALPHAYAPLNSSQGARKWPRRRVTVCGREPLTT